MRIKMLFTCIFDFGPPYIVRSSKRQFKAIYTMQSPPPIRLHAKRPHNTTPTTCRWSCPAWRTPRPPTSPWRTRCCGASARPSRRSTGQPSRPTRATSSGRRGTRRSRCRPTRRPCSTSWYSQPQKSWCRPTWTFYVFFLVLNVEFVLLD